MIQDVFTADSLCRSFGATQVLHNVSFSIPQGSVCSLLGKERCRQDNTLEASVGFDSANLGCVFGRRGQWTASQPVGAAVHRVSDRWFRNRLGIPAYNICCP